MIRPPNRSGIRTAGYSPPFVYQNEIGEGQLIDLNQRRSALRQYDAVREFALAYPEAFEDFPWNIPVVKVGGRQWPAVFLWLGLRDADHHAVYVKLTHSYDQAVAMAGATPTTMSGVGMFGRLTIALPVADLDLLCDWIDESYRNVAPRRLVKELGGRPDGVR